MQPLDIKAMASQMYTPICTHLGNPLKNIQADWNAHPAIWTQNRIVCPDSSFGNCGYSRLCGCERVAAG
jgi:hypothetical protein